MTLPRGVETFPGALDAAARVLEAPTLIVAAHGRVVYANGAARWLLDHEGAKTHARVMRMISRPRTRGVSTVTLLALEGLPAHHLIVLRDPASRIVARTLAATRSWHLTPRQAKVLACLVRGESNRTIAAQLGCAEVTVESHVTAILRKSKCENRVHVVARFWSDR